MVSASPQLCPSGANDFCQPMVTTQLQHHIPSWIASAQPPQNLLGLPHPRQPQFLVEHRALPVGAPAGLRYPQHGSLPRPGWQRGLHDLGNLFVSVPYKHGNARLDPVHHPDALRPVGPVHAPMSPPAPAPVNSLTAQYRITTTVAPLSSNSVAVSPSLFHTALR